MGCASSKMEKDEALLLCKERKKFLKMAIDRRYGLAAAHVAYIQSLRNVGISLLRFAEAEYLPESSSSTTEPSIVFMEKASPSSHLSNFPSPDAVGAIDSPEQGSPSSPTFALSSQQNRSTVKCMKSGRNAVASTFKQKRPEIGSVRFVQESDFTISPEFLRPPPRPPMDSSWDFFDPVEESDGLLPSSARDAVSMPHGTVTASPLLNSQQNRARIAHAYTFNGFPSEGFEMENLSGKQSPANAVKNDDGGVGSEDESLVRAEELVSSSNALALKESTVETRVVGMLPEREDSSEFFTHRAKDFLSSIKEINHWFTKAFDAGKEVSRMLEATKVQPSCTEFKDGPQIVSKVISWHRSTSSRSFLSSHAHVLADADDSGSDFVEDFCMISGSHSSTLDRMHAWERKLFDEVKASESIRWAYDRKCKKLRHDQFVKNLKKHVIDKTRAAVKDLYSRTKVAIQSVESISKKIEKLRDEELQPQLLELIQGSIRMWKVMIECHRAQYITMSSVYHTKIPTGAHVESRREVALCLENEINCLNASFANYIDAQKSYLQALNCWLRNCIKLPLERSARGRKIPFSPRRALAPPIFVLCRDWSVAIDSLPAGDVSNAMKTLATYIHLTVPQSDDDQKEGKGGAMSVANGTEVEIHDQNSTKSDTRQSKMSSIHASLNMFFDRMTKFAEASLKMHEDIQKGTEAACTAYNGSNKVR